MHKLWFQNCQKDMKDDCSAVYTDPFNLISWCIGTGYVQLLCLITISTKLKLLLSSYSTDFFKLLQFE